MGFDETLVSYHCTGKCNEIITNTNKGSSKCSYHQLDAQGNSRRAMANSLYRFIYNKYRSALLFRRWRDAESVGLNGQQHRKQIFRDLVNMCAFDAIVETGTFKGDSAAYMAQTANLPVYTSEVNARFSFLARVRLRSVPNVKFFVGDSRKFLQHLPAVLKGRAKRLF